jgi:hypothetical protein
VKTIFRIAKAIEKTTIPEGVRNDTARYIRTVLSLNSMRRNQVDTEAIYQGYKLAFPQNAQELDEWMLGEDEYGEW